MRAPMRGLMLLLLLAYLGGMADAACSLAGWHATAALATGTVCTDGTCKKVAEVGKESGTTFSDDELDDARYPANQECFRAYEGCTYLSFTSFDLEAKTDGANEGEKIPTDWLSLYDGPTESSTVLIDKADGTNMPTDKKPTSQTILFKFRSDAINNRHGFYGQCFACGAMTISHSVEGATVCAPQCGEGQCCGWGLGLSADGNKCEPCAAGSYSARASANVNPGQCKPCSEGTGSLDRWAACMPGGVTWKLGAAGASCDATCAAAKDVGSCVEEALVVLPNVAEATSDADQAFVDLMKQVLVKPSKGLGSEGLACARYSKGEDPIPPYEGRGHYFEMDKDGVCLFPRTTSEKPNCTSKDKTSIRRFCPCGCLSGTTASIGTTGPCQPCAAEKWLSVDPVPTCVAPEDTDVKEIELAPLSSRGGTAQNPLGDQIVLEAGASIQIQTVPALPGTFGWIGWSQKLLDTTTNVTVGGIPCEFHLLSTMSNTVCGISTAAGKLLTGITSTGSANLVITRKGSKGNVFVTTAPVKTERTCPKGQRQNPDDPSSCELCADGLYSDEIGLKECKACKAGWYAVSNGATGCQPCPSIKGRFGNAKTCPEGVVMLPAELNGSLWWNVSANNSVFYSCREGAGCAFKRDQSESSPRSGLLSANTKSELGWFPFCEHKGHGGPLCAVCLEGYYMNGGGCEACPDEGGGGADYQTALYTAVGVALTVVTCVSLLFACYVVQSVGGAESYLDEVEVEGADDGLEGNMEGTGEAAAGSAAAAASAVLGTLGKSTATVGACGAWLKNVLKDKLKIFISYAQLVGSFRANFTVPWPAELTYMFSVFQALSFKVNIPTFGCSSELTYYSEFAFTMSTPLLLTLLVLLGYGVGLLEMNQMTKKKKKALACRARAFWRARMLQVWSILMFLCYPTVCVSICQMMLPPVEVDGVSYVSPDMSLIFTTATHDANVGAAGVFAFLYILGIPGLFFAILRQQRHHIFSVLLESDVGEYQAFETDSDDTTKLVRCIGRTPMNVEFGTACTLLPDTKYTVTAFDDETGEAQLNLDNSLTITNNPDDAFEMASMSFGWMCANYEPRFWYWELIEFLRKFILSSALIFFNPGTNSQVLIAVLVCVFFLCIVATYKPYRDDGDDKTNTVAYVCLVFTLVLGMALKVQQYEASDTAEQDEAIYTALLIIVNVALAVFAVWQMIMDAWDDANDKAEKTMMVVSRLSRAVNDVALTKDR